MVMTLGYQVAIFLPPQKKHLILCKAYSNTWCFQQRYLLQLQCPISSAVIAYAKILFRTLLSSETHP